LAIELGNQAITPFGRYLALMRKADYRCASGKPRF
jgi:hypothetical protein